MDAQSSTDIHADIATLPEALQDEDARSELKSMQSQFGSWKTAFLCISPSTVWQTKCLSAVVRPIWNHNTHRVTTIRGPQANLQYEIEMATGAWQTEITDIVAQTLNNTDVMASLGLTRHHSDTATKTADFFNLVMVVMRERAQSLSHHSEEPPKMLAAILHNDPIKAQQAADKVASGWQNLLQTEQLDCIGRLSRHSPLRKVFWAKNRLIRFAFLLLEAGLTQRAHSFLTQLFSNMGDEKLVEDIHQHIRDLDRHNRNNRSSIRVRMVQALSSGVLANKAVTEERATQDEVLALCKSDRRTQQRQIPHPLNLLLQFIVMLQRSPQTVAHMCTVIVAPLLSHDSLHVHSCCFHKIPRTSSIADDLDVKKHYAYTPKAWQQVLAQRTWESPTNDSLYTGMAAWQWIQHFWAHNLSQDSVSLDDGWAASLLQFQDAKPSN